MSQFGPRVRRCLRTAEHNDRALGEGGHIVLAGRVGGFEGATLLPNEEESCAHVRIVKWRLVRRNVRTCSSLSYTKHGAALARATGGENVRGAGDAHRCHPLSTDRATRSGPG